MQTSNEKEREAIEKGTFESLNTEMIDLMAKSVSHAATISRVGIAQYTPLIKFLTVFSEIAGKYPEKKNRDVVNQALEDTLDQFAKLVNVDSDYTGSNKVFDCDTCPLPKNICIAVRSDCPGMTEGESR